MDTQNTGPNGQSVPAQMKENGGGTHSVEFSPKVVGEHKIMVNYRGVAVAGSPFGCKVYDCKAIKVKNIDKGVVGKPITFLGEFYLLIEYLPLIKKKKKIILKLEHYILQ